MTDNIKKIISNVSNVIFIIDEKMSSNKEYKKFSNEIYDYLKAGYEYKELRECPVYFRFHKDSEIIQMQMRHFMTNLLFWSPLITLRGVEDLDESFIVDCSKLNASYIKSYVDIKLLLKYRMAVSNKEMNIILHDLIYNLAKISNDFNIILGMSMNIEAFITTAQTNKKFNDIIRTKLDPNMQPSEIESTLDGLLADELEILKDEPTVFRPLIRSGAGIKTKQLSEFSISGGLKPDLSGNTIPVPINSNLVVGGLGNVTNYLIDSIGGRKSLIMNKSMMGKSGHFARKSILLVSNVNLRKDAHPCNTVHSISITIRSAEYLKRFTGRYYRRQTDTKYRVLLGNEKHLIGETLLFKSPATCASKSGVCRECYGDVLYYTNRAMNIGAYAGAIITAPVTQSILSSKHLLSTTSETIEFTPEFDNFFITAANEVILNMNNDNLSDYSLVLIHDNIVFINELDEGEINEFVSLFHVRNDKTGEMYEIYEKNGNALYISPELNKELGIGKKSKKVYSCPLNMLPVNSRLFILEVENAELTRPLYNIMGLLDTKGRREQLGIDNIDSMAQTFIDLLIESKIDVQSVHAEVMLHQLIRKNSNILDRPDFSKYNAEDDMQILTVEGALEKHPSVLVGLSFQFLSRQLLSPLTFKKTAPSYIDSFFKERP